MAVSLTPCPAQSQPQSSTPGNSCLGSIHPLRFPYHLQLQSLQVSVSKVIYALSHKTHHRKVAEEAQSCLREAHKAPSLSLDLRGSPRGTWEERILETSAIEGSLALLKPKARDGRSAGSPVQHLSLPGVTKELGSTGRPDVKSQHGCCGLQDPGKSLHLNLCCFLISAASLLQGCEDYRIRL